MGRMPNAAGPVPAGASTPTRTPDASTQIVGSTPDSAEIVVNVICSDTTCTPQETVSSIQIERVTYGIDCSDINYYYGFYDFYESSLSTMLIPSCITMLMSLFLLL